MPMATASTTTPAPAAAPPADAPPVEACPRCEKPLIDPARLGWCQACGYCRSLDEDRARLPLAPEANPTAAPVAPSMPAAPFPLWVIGLLVGIVALAAGS